MIVMRFKDKPDYNSKKYIRENFILFNYNFDDEIYSRFALKELIDTSEHESSKPIGN